MADLENREESVPPAPTKPVILRDERGRLLPGGAVLNPGGRPKSFAASIRAELGQGGERLWRRMIDIWEGNEKGFGPRERMEAGKWLSDRGYGRVAETQIQIQAEASEVEGATEAAADALLHLAGDLSTDPAPTGGIIGGSDSVTPETH